MDFSMSVFFSELQQDKSIRGKINAGFPVGSISFFFFAFFSVSISFVHITQTQPNGFISFLGKRHVNSSAFTMKLKMESAAKKIFCILLVEIRRSFLFTSKTSVK